VEELKKKYEFEKIKEDIKNKLDKIIKSFEKNPKEILKILDNF